MYTPNFTGEMSSLRNGVEVDGHWPWKLSSYTTCHLHPDLHQGPSVGNSSLTPTAQWDMPSTPPPSVAQIIDHCPLSHLRVCPAVYLAWPYSFFSA